MTSLLKKLSMSIKNQNSRSQTAMASDWSVSKLRPNPSALGSRRELIATCVHTADSDATQLDSCVASALAVCIGLYHQRIYANKCKPTVLPDLRLGKVG